MNAAAKHLDVPALAGMYIRKLCVRCGGQGCLLCNEGYTWVSVYAAGRGEQGDDFRDVAPVDEQMEAGHA